MQITLCLYPRFSNHCLANALEPLRAANDLSGEQLYSWRIASPAGAPVRSSSGLDIAPDMGLDDARGDALFLLPSYAFEAFTTPAHGATLRRAATRHAIVAGLDMGAWLMASAGLLTDKKATVHWDEFARFSNSFPRTEALPDRVVKDGNRWTCGGATTAFDMVLGLIEAQHGASLRLDVAGLFMHGEWRGALPSHPSGEARVDAAVALMRRNLSAPMPLTEIARGIGLSPRRMEALFQDQIGQSPQARYKTLRLDEVRRLLRHSALSISEIAAMAGYEDASAMGRAFKRETGTSPTAWRKQARGL